MPATDYKKEIIKKLSSAVGKKVGDVLEVPPDPQMGDYAFPCFSLAKDLKKSPAVIAQELREKIKAGKYISEVRNIGPYVNFFIRKEDLSKNILKEVFGKLEKFGRAARKKKTVLIESPGPNTNKPLHLGHVRNMVLGNSLVEIFRFAGYDTKRVDILNNRGVHICKSMLAYTLYGNNAEPDKKTDHFVGDFYVRYAMESEKHPEYEDMLKSMLKRWEEDDPEMVSLWSRMNEWALTGIMQTYKRYGVRMDKAYSESDHYKKGREVALEGVKKRIFQTDENNNIIVDLEKAGLGKKVLLRSDGTSVYITQDLALAELRYNDFRMDKIIYIVGSEQIHHFKVLFKIYELFKFPFAKDCYHLPMGMIYLPEGKMKSREGKVVDADNFADEIHAIARDEILSRYPDLPKDEIDQRAEKIGLGAIKFFILKYDAVKDFVYNPKESISFEGETGPYVQYSHARASSILRKYGKKAGLDVDFALLSTEEEKGILKLLSGFPDIITDAADQFRPSLITRHLLDLSQAFNEYYHKHKIIQEDQELERARILLVFCVRQVLENGLGLLGIDAPDVM